jgi:hypothetical protein
VLTDRRLIIRGRDHQTIYPLRLRWSDTSAGEWSCWAWR